MGRAQWDCKPVADVYQGTDMNNNYNSDSHLFMSPDGLTMHLIWRRKNGWNNELTYMKTSTDGINWSATTTILSVLGTNPTLNESTLSPCMLYNGTGYMLWTVNTKVTPRSIYMRFKSDLNGSWSNPVLTDIGEFTDTYRVWHMDVEFIDGYYHMLAAVGMPTTQEGRVLYLGKSMDGIHWTFSSAPVMLGVQGGWDVRHYRPAFLRDESGIGYKNWYGSMNQPRWRIGYSESIVTGYLHAPQNVDIHHTYDGVNHFQMSWDAPNPDVIGYKVFCNYDEVASLSAAETGYTVSSNELAQYDAHTVLAVKAIYGTGESDPVVIRMDSYLGNPSTPMLSTQMISIYPNPFKDSFAISSKQTLTGTMKLYNLKGQLAGSWKVKDNSSIKPDPELSSGIYYYSIETKDGIHKGKVLKIK